MRRTSGVAGNGRLTSLVGLILLVLLAVEGATITSIQQLLSVHVFVGMLLLGPVALKLATTGYRFARYYTGVPEYVREGPPPPLMRLLVAPVLVLSTLTLFGSGVALLAVPHRGAVLGLHKASFIVWFGAMTIHVLAYTLRALKRVRSDLSGRRLPGRGLRVAASLLAVVAGAALAVATYPLARPWFHSHFFFEREGARGIVAARTTAAMRGTPPRPRTDPAWLALGLPPVHPGPLPGYLLIADRNNNRALIVSPAGKIVWIDSSLRGPDDAFFAPGWHSIITNEEFNDTLTQVSLRGRHVVWSYGHAGTPGSSPGYLNTPDDAYRLVNGDTTVADIKNCFSSFTYPGRIVEMTPAGMVTWSFGDSSGPNLLDKPSLAVRLANGLIAANDDYGDRVILIDPRTHRIVWQYGHTGVPSSAPGYLSKPDGLDFLPARVVAASAPRRAVTAAGVSVTRVGRLPVPVLRVAAVALGGRRVMVLGGLAGGSSSTQILAGPPQHLERVGTLPLPTHDAAAVLLGKTVYLLGGGQATSSDAVVRITPDGRARQAGTLGEPLSDLGAAVAGKTAYIAGGYTGSQYATGILAFRGKTPTLAARLPAGLRYAGVASLGRMIYVAGGITTTGTSSAVYRFDPATGAVEQLATLPRPIAHAPLVALDGSLYLLGGDGSDAVRRIGTDGTVTLAGHLPHPLANAAAVALGGSARLFGGDGSDAVLRLTPKTP